MLELGRVVETELTEFGRAVWVLAAKRDIRTQRSLARAMGVNHETLRNYLHGRTVVPSRVLKRVDAALQLTGDEKEELAWVFAWGETVRKTTA